MSQLSLQALSAIDLFAVLPPAEREHLAKMSVIRRFEAKESLFEEGQPCEGVWIVASGSVRIYKFTPGGRQIVLAVQEAPATVAEVPEPNMSPHGDTATARRCSPNRCSATDESMVAAAVSAIDAGMPSSHRPIHPLVGDTLPNRAFIQMAIDVKCDRSGFG